MEMCMGKIETNKDTMSLPTEWIKRIKIEKVMGIIDKYNIVIWKLREVR